MVSHIMPRFVYRQFKKRSLTGFSRDPSAVNSRRQAQFKLPLLCAVCEYIFSIREEFFSRTVFLPYLDGRLEITRNDQRIRYFANSLVWRYMLASPSSPHTAQAFKESLAQLLRFQRRASNVTNIYLLPCERLARSYALLGMERFNPIVAVDRLLSFLKLSIFMHEIPALGGTYTVFNLMGLLVVSIFDAPKNVIASWDEHSSNMNADGLRISTAEPFTGDAAFLVGLSIMAADATKIWETMSLPERRKIEAALKKRQKAH